MPKWFLHLVLASLGKYQLELWYTKTLPHPAIVSAHPWGTSFHFIPRYVRFVGEWALLIYNQTASEYGWYKSSSLQSTYLYTLIVYMGFYRWWMTKYFSLCSRTVMCSRRTLRVKVARSIFFSCSIFDLSVVTHLHRNEWIYACLL
jgi:hypothetical protein